MTWYGASLLFTFKLIEGQQHEFTVIEEVYLIESDTDKGAWDAAEMIGKQEEAVNDETEVDGIPANTVFIGIRKIRSIYNPEEAIDIDSVPPSHGSSITRSSFYVASNLDLDALAQGFPVDLRYLDGKP